MGLNISNGSKIKSIINKSNSTRLCSTDMQSVNDGRICHETLIYDRLNLDFTVLSGVSILTRVCEMYTYKNTYQS